MTIENEKRTHFIRQIIEKDLAEQKIAKLVTRFPPEPNGYLHIGHAKSICLNFGISHDYQGDCFLRLDDTNPIKEEQEYIDAIIEDVSWLGFEWGERLTHASDYYQQLYDYAVQLIKQGNAYVDSLSADKMREYRGTLTTQGKESPYRNRSIDENLDLFQRMKAGEFKEGEHILRAKIDMGAANINLRDPALYRIRFAHHQRTGDKWCVYPMYDFAHSLSDAIEHITHSLCTLEFQDHRPLYNWFIETLELSQKPQQIEFARFNLSHTITSKRKLKRLVDEGLVSGWDDPRMPTLRGMRERGTPPASIRKLCEITGISKTDSTIDMTVFEQLIREELNHQAPRAMAVLNPLKVVIENYPEDKTETLKAPVHPQDESKGVRKLPFSREIYIERDDFMEEPEKKFFRLAPGKEVRLRNAYVIKCERVIKDEQGEVIELRCRYDEATLGKKPEGRKVKGVIHWVSQQQSLPCELTIFDRLFEVENPGALEDFESSFNQNSKVQLEQCKVETNISDYPLNTVFQFERQGYFCLKAKGDLLKLYRVVGLHDSWEKIKEAN